MATSATPTPARAAGGGRALVHLLATHAHYLDHGLPVWRALPESARGHVVAPPALHKTHPGLAGLRPRLPAVIRPRDLVIVTSSGNRRAAARRGARIIMLEHGSGQTFRNPDGSLFGHTSYAGSADRDRVELFLMPGRIPATAQREATPGVPVQEVGCPKLDAVERRPPVDDVPIVVLSWHWDCKVLPETRSAFPAFADATLELARRTDIRVMVHAHPRMTDTVQAWARRNGLPFVPTFDEVLRTARAYLSDVSSTIWEAAAVGVPVGLMNLPTYRRDVEHGMRFWELASVGPHADRPQQLAQVVDDVLADTPQRAAERQRIASVVYTIPPGHSSRAAARAISTHLERSPTWA